MPRDHAAATELFFRWGFDQRDVKEATRQEGFDFLSHHWGCDPPAVEYLRFPKMLANALVDIDPQQWKQQSKDLALKPEDRDVFRRIARAYGIELQSGWSLQSMSKPTGGKQIKARKRTKARKAAEKAMRAKGVAVANVKRAQRGPLARQLAILGSGGLGGRSGSDYLGLLRDPLGHPPARIPDGYHAETAALKLSAAGIIWSTDQFGRALMMVDTHGMGQTSSMRGTLPTAANTDASVVYSASRRYLNQYNVPFMWDAIPSLLRGAGNWNRVSEYAGLAVSANIVEQTAFLGAGTMNAAGFGTFTNPAQVFPGLDQFVSLYNQVRFVCGAVQFTYTGPHGDSQKGALYVNTSQFGIPDDGCSHFETVAALKSHPSTIKLPLGTSVTIPLYPVDVVGEGFLPVSDVKSVVTIDPSADSSTKSGTTLNNNVCMSPYKFTGAVSTSSIVNATNNGDNSTEIRYCIPPKQGNVNGGTPAAPAWGPLDGNIDGETHDAQDVVRGATSGIANQLPVLYACIEGGPTNSGTANYAWSTAQYDIKVVFNVEAVVRPSASTFVGAQRVPDAPAAVAAGKRVMGSLGDIAMSLGRTALSVAAPYASELGSQLGGAALAVLRSRL